MSGGHVIHPEQKTNELQGFSMGILRLSKTDNWYTDIEHNTFIVGHDLF